MSKVVALLRLLSPNIMLAIGFVVIMILSFKNCKRHGLSKLNTLLFMVCGYCGGIFSAALMGNLYTKVASMYGGGGSRVAIFGVVVSLPFFLIPASFISGKSWRDVTDLFAPGAFLGLAFSKFGCFFYGCCPGIECEFGVYNHLQDKVMFPSQLVESITMCFVVGLSFWYNYKYKKKVPGTAYPVTAVLYAFTRFCWEFLRFYDVEEMKHLLFGLSFWQLWCIVTFVGACVWLLILKIPKLPEYEEKCYNFTSAQRERIMKKLKGQSPDEEQTAKPQKAKSKKSK